VNVMVRKRPLNKRELAGKSFDVVTMFAPDTGLLVLHEPKCKVDLSKCVEGHTFLFDQVFDEATTNEEVFDAAVKPLVDEVLSARGCMATAFAYGQTGSGKTHTMSAVYAQAAAGVLAGADVKGLHVLISFFEIYGGSLFDLLAGRKPLKVLEDGKGEVNVLGMCCLPVKSVPHVADGSRPRQYGVVIVWVPSVEVVLTAVVEVSVSSKRLVKTHEVGTRQVWWSSA